MTAVAVVVSVLLGLITAAIFGSVAGGLRLIGNQSEPEFWRRRPPRSSCTGRRPICCRAASCRPRAGAGIFQYDAALARAISAYHADNADVRFGGYFGVEFRNITFVGERAAAEQTLAAYQVYERDDRHIRALNRSGDLRAAIAFDTSYAPGNSNWAFTQYDNALVGLIAINQRAFTGAISAGQQDMNGWTGYIPAGAAILIIILVLAGIRPRLAEYR